MRPSAPELRRLSGERAGYRCEYCLTPESLSTQALFVDHVVPRKRGGETAPENLALACPGCNHFKHARIDSPDPLTLVQVPLFNPRRDNWNEHFCWSPDLTEIVGLTATGRATVRVLRLNRDTLRTLRLAMILVKKHPGVD
jgi:hypothetical protein